MTSGNTSKEELEFHLEHYLAAVAEHLMTQGAAVSHVHSCGPYATADGYDFPDIEGALFFTPRFSRQVGGLTSVDLHWEGTSGWCLGDTNHPEFPQGARWLGDGLLPEPERVAAFMDTYRLNPGQAGSTERPYYRSEGSDFPALIERLAAYVPSPSSLDYEPGRRFLNARDKVYLGRVLTALTPQGTDLIEEVPLRTSELNALLTLLEYAEAAAGTLGPDGFAGLLADDLEGRRRSGYDAVDRHRSALVEAADRQKRIEDHRRNQGNQES
ncbi:DUF6292 family protein [Streptomyces viridosporus]|uniref:DUF6292 family protein n=1 Tax=Streptomyces viridosporus TaxID=67581 RepID=UPI00332DFFAE